jgi:hypothetical protein
MKKEGKTRNSSRFKPLQTNVFTPKVIIVMSICFVALVAIVLGFIFLNNMVLSCKVSGCCFTQKN